MITEVPKRGHKGGKSPPYIPVYPLTQYLQVFVARHYQQLSQ